MLSAYQSLLARLQSGQPAVLVSRLASGETALWPESKAGDSSRLPPVGKLEQVLHSSRPVLTCGAGEDPLLIEPFYPQPRLIILGGGHVAQPLADFAAKSGFAVTVVDDRPAFANNTRFPDAEQVICADMQQSVARVGLNDYCYLVIVTRGHRHDLDCLRLALNCPTAYLGMIGSRRRVQATRELLLAEGCDEQQLGRLHAPIGLGIGAVTPPEIAISILAELIAVRRKRRTASDAAGAAAFSRLDCDQALLCQLAMLNGRVAVATVLATKGSVPRGAGAKLLVWPDGHTSGTIGGGCTEAAVICHARDLLNAGGYSLHNLDLTAELAEEAGMVCGGTMEVLITCLEGEH